MELFIKRFIDLLDEEIPVSMVHTLIEQPLGAVMNESYVMIHARKDLVDGDSPYVEIEIYPIDYHKVRFLFAFTFPKNSIQIDQSKFEDKLKENKNIKAEKIIPLDHTEEGYYEIFAESEWKIPENNAEVDQVIVKIVEYIEEWMSSSGYQSNEI
ncbi:hypothetical protein [Tepidibacillus fermentans]|uniref:Sensory transduction regulator n=1 Tax=Tepidibacillus fermentans TaxID=1281767 RepID=A0A4R3KJR6_9BACI|nr:hypothetical protein [Tepidibacillus fermentans]TCS84015.1 hypothetical protein EDD72_10255 [Tepidibacillus fermentans]